MLTDSIGTCTVAWVGLPRGKRATSANKRSRTVSRRLLLNHCNSQYVPIYKPQAISNARTVGSYGGGLHWSDVPDENKIPFFKVCKALERLILQTSDSLDYIRNNGHVWADSLSHKSVAPLDHGSRIQSLPKMRHVH
jgi:hypothetical protein